MAAKIRQYGIDQRRFVDRLEAMGIDVEIEFRPGSGTPNPKSFEKDENQIQHHFLAKTGHTKKGKPPSFQERQRSRQRFLWVVGERADQQLAVMAAKKSSGSSVASSPEKKKKRGIFGLFRGKSKARKSTDETSTAATPKITPLPTPPVEEQPQQAVSTPSPAPPPPKASWFCRTKYFKQLCDTAFDGVDLDGSGSVDEKELYSGLLLIHLKLGCYAGPAACRPLSRDRAQRVFERFDADKSGCLDREEFRSVMTVLFGNVFFRVLVQWSMTLMIVPMVAQSILDGVQFVWSSICHTIATMDEHSEYANSVELAMEGAYATLMNRVTWLTPYTNKLNTYLEMVPESAWEAIPLAIISTILGIMVVPWCIFQVDDFFQRVAGNDTKKEKKA